MFTAYFFSIRQTIKLRRSLLYQKSDFVQATQQNPVSTFHSKLRCQTFISITRNILAAKIKYSREEIKVLEKMRRSDFANFQLVLLLLWSRLEFRSRSTLSIHQELDQVKETFVSDIRGVVPGGGTHRFWQIS